MVSKKGTQHAGFVRRLFCEVDRDGSSRLSLDIRVHFANRESCSQPSVVGDDVAGVSDRGFVAVQT